MTVQKNKKLKLLHRVACIADREYNKYKFQIRGIVQFCFAGAHIGAANTFLNVPYMKKYYKKFIGLNQNTKHHS